MDDRPGDMKAGGAATGDAATRDAGTRDAGTEPRVLRSGQVRIVGAEPVSEGASGSASPAAADVPGDATPPVDDIELPHWTEAPTGQVPAVLSRDVEGDQEADPWSAMPAPTWREEQSDWVAQEETFEPSMLADEDDARTGSLDDTELGGSELNERQPWSFDLDTSSGLDDEPTTVLPAVGPSEHRPEEDMDPATPRRERRIGDLDREPDGEPSQPTIVISGRNDSSRALGAGALGAGAPENGAPENGAPENGETALGAPSGVGTGTGAATRAGAAAEVGAGAEVARRSRTARRGASRRSVGSRSSGSRGGNRGPEAAADATTGVGTAARYGSAPYGGPRRRPNEGAELAGGVGAGAVTRSARNERGSATGRNLPVAIVSGLALGVVTLICFKLGTVASMVIVTLVVTLAAVEAYAAFRKAGQHPATLLGLVATVGLLVATYDKGQQALPLIAVLLFAATVVWHLAHVEPGADPLRSLLSTVLVFSWVGVFGSFAALLLDPTLFPNRHGIAFLLGAVITAVAYDVGALAVGSRLARHPLTSVSPHKSWEGAIGGALAAVVVGAVVVHLIHPWTLGSAIALGAVVAVVSPIGDLAESLVKRHLNLKDMSRILPGHGGILDRVDGLLFVLPATYYLVKAFRLG